MHEMYTSRIGRLQNPSFGLVGLFGRAYPSVQSPVADWRVGYIVEGCCCLAIFRI